MRDIDLDAAAPTPERSKLMSRVQQKNTKPEIMVRRLLHAMGYRFRLHYGHLPGTPDVVFPARRKAIFVHGCFWHRHQGCKKASTPKTRRDFWISKFQVNEARDARSLMALKDLGWTTMVVWECEVNDANLNDRLHVFLEADDHGRRKVGTNGTQP